VAQEFRSKEAVKIYSEGVIAEELTLRPVLLELLGDIRNKKILDLGCGDGRYSTLFAQLGAAVIATDFSSHQIEIAKQKNTHPNICYSVGDVSSGGAGPESQDIVFANLVVPSLGQVEKLVTLFSVTREVLKADGRFIFSILHPLYLSKEQDSYDRAVDFHPESYFKEGTLFHSEALTKAGSTMHFEEAHFSLTHISKVLKEQGFFICLLAESLQVPEKEMFLPKYLAFECIKS